MEAEWFVNNCQGYIGKGLLILDWERGGNPDVTRVDRALRWLQHVEALTGVKPLIYMSASLITELDWSSVINNGNGLWVAAYVDNNTPIPNYQMDANRDPNPHWDGAVNDVMWQFTSTGRLDGYGGNLDCNFFYGTREAWDAYARSNTATPAPVQPEPTPAPAPEPVVQPEPTPEPTPPVLAPQPGEVVVPPVPEVPVPVEVEVPDPAPKPPVVVVSKKTLFQAVFVRAFHTFWQSFIAVFTVSITGLTSNLLNVHNVTDAKAFGLAVAVAVGAAILSAVKNLIAQPQETK